MQPRSRHWLMHLVSPSFLRSKSLCSPMPRGNVAEGCEQEMDLLKDDRFLSGANWGLVRKYLPDRLPIL